MSALRISIIGCSGSGKTTLAHEVESRLGLPRLELDGVFHQADWQPLDEDAFRLRVSEFMDAHESWVIDGNYKVVADLIRERATILVWLHPPRWRTMLQIASRTLRRAVMRTELWNGNRESWRDMFSRDPQRSMLAWTWTQYPVYEERYARLSEDPRWAQLQCHKFVSHGESERWLMGLVQGKAT